MRKSLYVAVLLVCLMLASFPADAQEPDLVAAWLERVNQIRLDEGLAPYRFSELLAVAAERHADDLVAHGFTDTSDLHLGSDGTHEQQRAADAGYAAWTWNSGELVVDENVSSYDTIDDSLAFFLGSTPHRDNILSSRYREIGIGVAGDGEGQYYHVLVFGVRPNVLPIFINDGAATTEDPQVAIRLTNEEARPDGQGANFMGRAIEIRISDEPNWDDRPWQPWEALVPWTLPETPGEHAVYVQYRDGASRTAAAADSIILDTGVPAPPTSVPPTPVPPTPTATPVPPSPTPEPTDVPASATAPAVPPTPEPSPAVELTSAPFVPSPSPPAAGPTPFPTWTPLPTAAPPQEAGDFLPLCLAAAVILQGLAVMLGIPIALRRGRGGRDGASFG